MTDWPLPFRPVMIRRLLAGLKTKTRRILTPHTTLLDGRPWSGPAKAQTWDWDNAWVDPGPSPAGNPGPYLKLPWLAGDADPFAETVHRIYPKVQPGDRMWVKEAHYLIDDNDRTYPVYAADGDASDIEAGLRLRPAMFMPRWASRLTLLVTDIGCERLQAISDEDALAEGCEPSKEFVGWWRCYTDEEHLCPTLRDSFISLWESIHGPGAFEKNPWVLVIGFETVKANIDDRHRMAHAEAAQ